MILYIPTYNRHQKNRAGTLRNWPKDFPVNLVVRQTQVEPYEQLIKELGVVGATILPIGQEGIASTRSSIINHAFAFSKDAKACMIDDDLGFLKRRDDHEWKLRGSENPEIVRMFTEIEEQLETYAHVGISCREGNNRIKQDFVLSSRGIRLVGYRADILKNEQLDFSTQLEGREDLDMTLKLLRRGYHNLVFYSWAQGQSGSDAPGGLSETEARTDAALTRTANALAEAHPGFVKVVEKTTKTSWGGKKRTDVMCYWKKAFASAGVVKTVR